MSDYSLVLMTEKQETILSVALRLFAERGYENTPTSLIAREAGVSEGLIFRHFENKDGLLRALVAEGQTRVQALMDQITRQTDPRQIIAQTIDLPQRLIDEEREFWRLQFAMKYKSAQAATLKAQSNYYGTLLVALTQAFASLGYPEPVRETELLILLLEGLGSAILTQAEGLDVSATVHFIKSKYNV